MRSVLVTDFDGTITRTDFYHLVRSRHMPPDAPDYFALYRSGRFTHFEAMRGVLSHTPTDDATLAGLLREMQPDPALGPAITRLRAAGWDIVIASAGSSWYIERVLAAAGVSVPVHASPGRIAAGRGLAMDLPIGSPFFSAQTGIDKSAVVRDALARYDRVAFAGDGSPDLPAALLVDGRLRFARGWLAGELQRRGLLFRAYNVWSEIAPALADGR